MSQQPLIIGHRGASFSAPENTLIAFKRAFQDGADGIEFDVRLARDRVPVIIHDADLHRTGLRPGQIADLSATDLAQVDVGTWFNLKHPSRAKDEYKQARVPTLAQVFELARQVHAWFYVEMKCAAHETGALAATVAALVHDYSLSGRVVVESFNLEAIAEIKRLDPQIRTAALFERKLSRPAPSMRRMLEQAARCQADELALHRTLTTPRITQEAARLNLKTVVWTVDQPAWIERARRYGLHAIITNKPALMSARRNSHPSNEYSSSISRLSGS